MERRLSPVLLGSPVLPPVPPNSQSDLKKIVFMGLEPTTGGEPLQR